MKNSKIDKQRQKLAVPGMKKRKSLHLLPTSKMIIRYCKTFVTIKNDLLEEMDKFLEMHKLPRLNQEEIENMNSPITRVKLKL